MRPVDPEILALAIPLREENPTRSVSQMIRLMELAQRIEPGSVKYSMLTYPFRRRGARETNARSPFSDGAQSRMPMPSGRATPRIRGVCPIRPG